MALKFVRPLGNLTAATALCCRRESHCPSLGDGNQAVTRTDHAFHTTREPTARVKCLTSIVSASSCDGNPRANRIDREVFVRNRAGRSMGLPPGAVIFTAYLASYSRVGGWQSAPPVSTDTKMTGPSLFTSFDLVLSINQLR